MNSHAVDSVYHIQNLSRYRASYTLFEQLDRSSDIRQTRISSFCCLAKDHFRRILAHLDPASDVEGLGSLCHFFCVPGRQLQLRWHHGCLEKNPHSRIDKSYGIVPSDFWHFLVYRVIWLQNTSDITHYVSLSLTSYITSCIVIYDVISCNIITNHINIISCYAKSAKLHCMPQGGGGISVKFQYKTNIYKYY